MAKQCAPGYNEQQTYPQTAPPSYDESRIVRGQVPTPYFPQYAPGYGYNQPINQYAVPSTVISNGNPHQASVVINQPGTLGTTVVVTQAHPSSDLSGHITFSCIVAWIFCFILGIIAYAIAVDASHAVTDEERRRKGRISFGFSIAGLIIGVSGYATLIGLWATFNLY